MSEPTTPDPAPEPVAEAPPAATPEATEERAGSRTWLGVLAVLVLVAVLLGMNVVLFTRVQDAQDRADQAVTLAGGSQSRIESSLADIDQQLGDLQAAQSTASNEAATLTSQVNALRKCVNNALDAIGQATQTGKPVSVTKC